MIRDTRPPGDARHSFADDLARNQAGRWGVSGVWLVLCDDHCCCCTGAVAPVFSLTACASASSTASSTTSAVARVAIPAAQTVTLSLDYGGNADGRKPPAPVTVTSSANVSEVAGLVTGQPSWPPGITNCPASDGKALTLVFRAHPGGPALATAVLGLDGCEITDLTVGAKDHAWASTPRPVPWRPGCSRSSAWPGKSRPSSGLAPI